jgi:hypothetical protein
MKWSIAAFLFHCLCIVPSLAMGVRPNQPNCIDTVCFQPIPFWEQWPLDRAVDKESVTFALTETDRGGTTIVRQQFISVTSIDIANSEIPKIACLPISLKKAMEMILRSYSDPRPTEFSLRRNVEVGGIPGLDVAFKNGFRQGRVVVAVYHQHGQILVIDGQALDGRTWASDREFSNLVSSIRFK